MGSGNCRLPARPGKGLTDYPNGSGETIPVVDLLIAPAAHKATGQNNTISLKLCSLIDKGTLVVRSLTYSIS